MTTSTLTISAFLLARIAEDEAVAEEVVRESGYPADWPISTGKDPWPGEFAFAAHITAARVLAECAAKRAIVEVVSGWKHAVVDDCWYTCGAATEGRDGGESCDASNRGTDCDCGLDWRVLAILAPLAAIWADHEDYRSNWA